MTDNTLASCSSKSVKEWYNSLLYQHNLLQYVTNTQYTQHGVFS